MVHFPGLKIKLPQTSTIILPNLIYESKKRDLKNEIKQNGGEAPPALKNLVGLFVSPVPQSGALSFKDYFLLFLKSRYQWRFKDIFV